MVTIIVVTTIMYSLEFHEYMTISNISCKKNSYFVVVFWMNINFCFDESAICSIGFIKSFDKRVKKNCFICT